MDVSSPIGRVVGTSRSAPAGTRPAEAALAYRPEIDGLRALAVLSVVLFHAGLPAFAGGFVGVDIFFVISGFLITLNIVRLAEEGRFTYAGFIERRVRRILPALVVVMAVTVPVAWATMLPDQLQNFGQSLVATVLSANNVLLTFTSGYWDTASEFKPLLHTWSLGVEEQFYLVFPFVVILLARFGGRRPMIALLALGAAASFALAALAPADRATAAFYLLHYRAWELLAGALAALVLLEWRPAPRNLLAGLGAAMMLAAVLAGAWTRDGTPWSTLVAVAGTGLFLLFADGRGPASLPFVWRPVVFIGLISYSFYLWHQPVFAFLRIGSFHQPGLAAFLGGTLLSAALATLTWWAVERPFRRARVVPTRVLYATTLPALALLGAVGLAMHLSDGVPARLEGSTAAANAGATIAYNERIRSLLPRDFPPQPDGRPRVAVLGNSFARDFSNVLLEAGLGDAVHLAYRSDIDTCLAGGPKGEDQLAFLRQADVVVFASGRYDPPCVAGVEAALPAAFAEGRVFFVGTKNFGHNLNPLVRLTAAERASTRLDIPEETLAQNARQAAALGARYIDVLGTLSTDGRTVRVADDAGELLSTDTIHLSQAGAIEVARGLPDAAPGLLALLGRGPGTE